MDLSFLILLSLEFLFKITSLFVNQTLVEKLTISLQLLYFL